MPNNVWCDNKDCFGYDEGRCGLQEIAHDDNGCCMGPRSDYEAYKNSKWVAETRRKDDRDLLGAGE